MRRRRIASKDELNISAKIRTRSIEWTIKNGKEGTIRKTGKEYNKIRMIGIKN